MRILVLVKEVPDTYGERKLNLETGLAERRTGPVVADEIDERSLEVAISYAEANAGTEVIVVSMAAASAQVTVRKGLAMGAASAVQVVDEALRGADIGLTAQVLATVIARTGYDLVITGNQSTDGGGGVLPAMIAERLGVPHATALTKVEIADGMVRGTRAADDGVATVSAALPAVISITEALPNARYPSFKGSVAAKKKPFETLSLSDLGIDAKDEAVPRSIITAVAAKPARKAGTKIVDAGDAGEKLAEFLVQHTLV